MTGMKLVQQVGQVPKWRLPPRPHFIVPTLQSDGVSALTSGDVFVQRTTPNTGASLSVKLFSATSKTFSAVASPVYASTDAAFTDIGLANVKVGDVVAITGSSAELTLKRHNGNSTVVANGGNISAGVDVSGNSSIPTFITAQQ